MLTKEELKIIDLFRKNLFKDYTIKEITKKTGKKSYSWVFQAIKKLNLLKIVQMKKKGHSNLCSINITNNLSLSYLALLELFQANSKKLPEKNIAQLIDSIPLAYFTFLITGSYAEGKVTKKSDLDIVLLVEDGVETKKILNILKNKGELMVPEVHPYVFTKSEFLAMLLAEEENYGKMVFRNRLIIFGAENYYSILKTAIKNGFKG